MLLVVVLNKNDLNSNTTFLEDANYISMPTHFISMPTHFINIMRLLFHFSLKRCLYDEGRRNVITDCSVLNYAHVWINVIRKLEQRRRRHRGLRLGKILNL